MKLTLDVDNPLMQALYNTPIGAPDTWLVLKHAGGHGETFYRAKVESWRTFKDHAEIEFSSWEEHVERLAKLSGL